VTTPAVDRVEIATGEDPVGAVHDALRQARSGELRPGGVYRVGVGHDDGCPCVTEGRPMTACTCEIVWLVREEIR
jgi:hypothetical protein